MRFHIPSRLGPSTALVVALALLTAGPAFARWQKPAPPRVVRPAGPPMAPRERPGPAISGGAIARQQQRQEQNRSRGIENQGHLAQWMQNHSNLSLADQQRALQNEPGFRELPQQAQQHYLNQLARLYNMNPQERARQLDQIETLERLSPGQRQQYAAAAQQWSVLPPPRRNMVRSAMRDLRAMPPAEREQIINSPAFAQQFPDPGDRAMIRTLLTGEPYPPTPAR